MRKNTPDTSREQKNIPRHPGEHFAVLVRGKKRPQTRKRETFTSRDIPGAVPLLIRVLFLYFEGSKNVKICQLGPPAEPKSEGWWGSKRPKIFKK